MGFEVQISGFAYEADSPSISIHEQARAVTQTSVSVRVDEGQSVPAIGQRVDFFLDSTRIFRGVISDVDYPEFSSGFEVPIYGLSVQSLEWILNARTITYTWYNKTYSEIVQSIFDLVLVEENLSVGSITTTSTVIKRYQAQGKKIFDVLSDIAGLIGPAVFWISPDAELFFIVDTEMETVSVPSDFTKVKLRESLSDLRSVQTVQGASARITATAQNATLISTLAARSGLSGKIESKDSNSSIHNPTAASDWAGVLLGQYDEVERNLSGLTADLTASQRYKIWPIDLPIGISGDFVVVERTIQIQSTADSTVSVQVKLKNRGYFQRYGFALKSISGTAQESTLSLLDIASDGKFTPAEKVQKRADWNLISFEYGVLLSEAASFGLDPSAYMAAFQALADMLNGGSTWSSGMPLWFGDDEMTMTETIDPDEFTTKWNNYAVEKSNLVSSLAAAVPSNVVIGTVSPPTIGGTEGLQYRDVSLGLDWVYQNGAWTTTENYFDDVVTPREKDRHKREWAAIEGEMRTYSALADATYTKGTSEWAAYLAAYNNLYSILYTTAGTNPPILSNLDSISAAVGIGDLLNASKNQYADAYADLQRVVIKAISDGAAQNFQIIDEGQIGDGSEVGEFDEGVLGDVSWDGSFELILDGGTYGDGSFTEDDEGEESDFDLLSTTDDGEVTGGVATFIPDRLIDDGLLDLFA